MLAYAVDLGLREVNLMIFINRFQLFYSERMMELGFIIQK